MDDEQRTNDARDVDRRVLGALLPGLSEPLAERVLALAPTTQRPLTGARLAEIRRALRVDRDELRAARPFVDRCLTGDADVDQVDEVVRSWRADSAGASLQRLLGLNDDEYDRWLRAPADRRATVAAAVAARRVHLRHEPPSAGHTGAVGNGDGAGRAEDTPPNHPGWTDHGTDDSLARALALAREAGARTPEGAAQAGALADEAERIVHGIVDPEQRALALAALSRALAEERLWDRAERAAHGIDDAHGRALALETLIGTLIEERLWDRAERAAHGIDDGWERHRVLARVSAARAWAPAGPRARPTTMDL